MLHVLWFDDSRVHRFVESADASQVTLRAWTEFPALPHESSSEVLLLPLSVPNVESNTLWHAARQVINEGHVGVVVLADPSQFEEAYQQACDEVLAWNASAEELTARLQSARLKSQQRRVLDRALRMQPIGELTSGIAHEINTPIQFIGDNVRFLRDSFHELTPLLELCQQMVEHADTIKSPEEMEHFLNQFSQVVQHADVEYLRDELMIAAGQSLEGIDRVSSIVRAMKEFVHPGSESMAATDLNRVIRNTVTVARNEWKYVADVFYQQVGECVPVRCLAGEISQVLLNLLVNSAQSITSRYGENSLSKGRIEIRLSQQDETSEIEIADDGVGIPVNLREKIFEPFFTTKGLGIGSGQGLAIARSIVEQHHGGTLTVRDGIRGGASFVIRLPMSFEAYVDPMSNPLPAGAGA